MSKWTLESIKANIQVGDRFSYEDFERELIVKFEDFGFRFFDTNYNGLNGYSGAQQWEGFRFYRNGEEILPPKDRELIKFTEKLIDSVVRFMTDDNRMVYQFTGELFLSGEFCGALVEEIPNARVLYRYADDLTISHWEEK